MRALALALAALLALSGCLETLDPGVDTDTPTLTVRPAPEDLELPDPPPGVAEPAGPSAETATAPDAAPTEALAAPRTVRVQSLDGAADEEAGTPERTPARTPSPAERACTDDGGRWARAGESGFICYRTPRDANKSCTRESDCLGACLARSRTYAPITPLLGCHEILTDSGTRATECKDV